jgi:pimeloyl-ACP methyl ester carboxylesterase
MHAFAPSQKAVALPHSALDLEFPQSLVTLPSGARVAVRRCGRAEDGPVLVVLHGISSGAASWFGPASQLARKHRIVAWDMPGYGQSTPLAAARPSAGEYAERLGETLDALGIDRCVLVGQSLGAIVATAFAQRDPHRVAGVVLFCPAQGYGRDPAGAERVRKARLSALESQGIAGLAARIDSRLLSAQATDEAREWVRWNAARLTRNGYAQAVEMLVSSTLEIPPSGIRVRVHVGEDDVVTPPASCEQAARFLGGEYSTFPAAGHASPIEQPLVVARLLAAAAAQMWLKSDA